MTERVFFNKLITKDLTATDSEQRFFEGYLTVEMVDKQNEITIVDELMKVLPIWMSRGAPISDTHSNRIVGKGINFHKTAVVENGVTYPAIYIQGMIYKGMGYELDDEIWDKIKDGTYKGLSFGGATKSDRIPVTQPDGTTSYALKDLEHYEVAVCEEPAVPLALITQFNPIAKAIVAKNKGKYIQKTEKEVCIRCNSFGCYVEKTSVNGMGPEIPEPKKEDKSFQDTKIVDDSPQAEGLPDKGGENNKSEEWSATDGVNRPQIDDQKVERNKGDSREKPQVTSGNQKDPTGECFEAVPHQAAQGANPGVNSDQSPNMSTGINSTGKAENEAFKPNDELLGSAGKSEDLEEEEKTLNPGENMNMEKPIRGLRGTGGEVGNRGGHSMMAGNKAAEKTAIDSLKKLQAESKGMSKDEYLLKLKAVLDKFDYDMRGIINDPETHDPRKEEEGKKDKNNVTPTLSANGGEDGKSGSISTNADDAAEAFDGSTGVSKVGDGQINFPGGGTRGGAYEVANQDQQSWDSRVTETGAHSRDTKRETSGKKDGLNTINTSSKALDAMIQAAKIRKAVTNL